MPLDLLAEVGQVEIAQGLALGVADFLELEIVFQREQPVLCGDHSLPGLFILLADGLGAHDLVDHGLDGLDLGRGRGLGGLRVRIGVLRVAHLVVGLLHGTLGLGQFDLAGGVQQRLFARHSLLQAQLVLGKLRLGLQDLLVDVRVLGALLLGLLQRVHRRLLVSDHVLPPLAVVDRLVELVVVHGFDRVALDLLVFKLQFSGVDFVLCGLRGQLGLIELLLRLLELGAGDLAAGFFLHSLQGLPGLLQLLSGPLDLVLLGLVADRGHADGGALIAHLQRAQGLLRLLDLGALSLAQDEENVPGFNGLPGLDHDRADLPRLLGLDHMVSDGGHSAGAAHLGGDGAAGHVLRGDLRQAPVHDGVGKEGQHQQHGQKDNGRVLDPFSVFRFIVHRNLQFFQASSLCMPEN